MQNHLVGGEAQADGFDTGDADSALYGCFLDVVQVAAGEHDATLLGFVLAVYLEDLPAQEDRLVD